MTLLKSKDVYKKLLSKGFKHEDNDHIHLIFYHENRTKIRTRISHGSGKNIDDYLIKQMSLQLHLEKSEFLELIDCKFSHQQYAEKMIKDKHIR